MGRGPAFWRKRHEVLLNKVARWLKNENKSDDIRADQVSANRPQIILRNGKTIYPDIINNTKKMIYEIHVKGERKEDYFDLLPNGWRGVNVFYDEPMNPETIVIKLDSFEIKRIEWDSVRERG